MYKISYENDEMVIRFKKDLVNDETLSKFLGHINLESVLKKSTATEVIEKLRAKNRLSNFPTGFNLLRDPALNKGTAFTVEEREILGLSGLLPPRVHTIDEQVERVLYNLRKKPTDMERYIFLNSLQDRNKTLFYRVLIDNIEELMPIVYTPTVGQACLEYGHIFRRPRGIYITARDKGKVVDLLGNWPRKDIRIIVVTDGERILGLGDLGADGMGIPVGKLALYSACGGIHPSLSLPVTIDVGTNNEMLLNDPLYIGHKHPRIRGEEYDQLIEEFILAVQQVFPGAMIQFEDFANRTPSVCCRCTAIRSAVSMTIFRVPLPSPSPACFPPCVLPASHLNEQRFLFMGAGEAGLGTGELVVSALIEDGLSPEEARKRCWYFRLQGPGCKGP